VSGPPDGDLVFPLAGLLAEPPGSARTFTIADARPALDEDLQLARPVSGTVWVSRTNRGLIVHADLASALAGACSRCLDPLTTSIRIQIDEEVLPSLDLASGHPLDTSAEPEVTRLNDHHELDLEPLIRDGISLAEPIAPLCRPDCPGLCPECGARLADGAHRHGDGEIDPRLEALRGFRVDGEGQNG